MRELKFRAWDDGELLEDVTPVANGDNNAFPNLAIVVFEANGETDGIRQVDVIEQYTGLKDKNGKEIYEGDIVDDGYYRTCKIRWSEHYTAFEAVNENDGYVSNIWFVAKYGTVIGNIHENPELLKEKE